MSIVKFVNIPRLMTTYNLEIDSEMLPENLKCAQCKLVLKDACAVPCGCTYCRVCIDDMMKSGSEFCPGVSKNCGESLLSEFAPDFRANKSVSELPVKCSQSGCLHECQLAELEEHVLMCGRKNTTCPFHELGCQQDILAAEEMSGHFQEENRSHCEILIRMIADINREMEVLKREVGSKDDQIKTIIVHVEHLENENKLIKQENADLADRVRIMSKKIEQEIDERRESDERHMTNVIEHIDTEITATKALIGSNKDQLNTAMILVKDDIRSINQDSFKLINTDIDCIKSRLESMQRLVGPGQIDASCEWTINVNVVKTRCSTKDSVSEYFIGAVYPYKYRLAAWNTTSELGIYLFIHPGEKDEQLPWPFLGTVAITVMDKTKRELFQTITRQCEISRPENNHYSNSVPFEFSHSLLNKAGLDLACGVRVSCVLAFSRAGQFASSIALTLNCTM